MALKIRNVKAMEVLDGVGFPTVEAVIELENGQTVSAICPSGTSTGAHEALDVRDGDLKWYRGNGVGKAVENVNGEIASSLRGMNAADQQAIDHALCALDGTDNKSRLGGNAITAVSLAAAKAGALAERITLAEHLAGGRPRLYTMPWLHLVSGGIHVPTLGLNGHVDFQEFEIGPVCAGNYREYFHLCWLLYFALLKRFMKFCTCNLLPIGAIAPTGIKTGDVIEQIMLGIHDLGLNPGKDVLIYLDVAASSLKKDGVYQLATDGLQLTSDEMADYIVHIVEKYPVYAVEDPLDEDDMQGWTRLAKRIGHKVELIGDDLFVTNPERIRTGIEHGTANAALIKVNQVGTVTEAAEAVELARSTGWRTVLSGRSREGEGGYLPHIAMGLGTEEGKLGGAFGSNAGYNELLHLEGKFGDTLEYAWKLIGK